jgi:hypothetical protein
MDTGKEFIPREVNMYHSARDDALQQLRDNPSGLRPEELYSYGITAEMIELLLAEGLVVEERQKSRFIEEDAGLESVFFKLSEPDIK